MPRKDISDIDKASELAAQTLTNITLDPDDVDEEEIDAFLAGMRSAFPDKEDDGLANLLESARVLEIAWIAGGDRTVWYASSLDPVSQVRNDIEEYFALSDDYPDRRILANLEAMGEEALMEKGVSIEHPGSGARQEITPISCMEAFAKWGVDPGDYLGCAQGGAKP